MTTNYKKIFQKSLKLAMSVTKHETSIQKKFESLRFAKTYVHKIAKILKFAKINARQISERAIRKINVRKINVCENLFSRKFMSLRQSINVFYNRQGQNYMMIFTLDFKCFKCNCHIQLITICLKANRNQLSMAIAFSLYSLALLAQQAMCQFFKILSL